MLKIYVSRETFFCLQIAFYIFVSRETVHTQVSDKSMPHRRDEQFPKIRKGVHPADNASLFFIWEFNRQTKNNPPIQSVFIYKRVIKSFM